MFKYLYCIMVLVLAPRFSYAMHIAEGFLPPVWCAFYLLLSLPFVMIGLKQLRAKSKLGGDMKLFIAVAAAFCFMLSALKLPSVTGSCSHPTGTGFGATIFGPFVMSVISVVVLLFQALFLAHGGLTTLGANTFSMGIVGPIVAYGIYRLAGKSKTGIFLASSLGNLATYCVTALQLAFAFPSPAGGVAVAAVKFLSIFALTQLPLAIVEGILTVIMMGIVEKYSTSELEALKGGSAYEA